MKMNQFVWKMKLIDGFDLKTRKWVVDFQKVDIFSL